MRLDREGLLPAVNGGLGDAHGSSKRAGAPLSAAVLRFGLQGSVDRLSHLVVLVGARPAGAELIVQAIQSQLSAALAPFARVISVRPIRLATAVLLSSISERVAPTAAEYGPAISALRAMCSSRWMQAANMS